VLSAAARLVTLFYLFNYIPTGIPLDKPGITPLGGRRVVFSPPGRHSLLFAFWANAAARRSSYAVLCF
ncbi:hypothetical protein, partial [uncultured Cardiobacterium sp.]|uniref:hypothetical protein n=1 Tax=uncultured Cardiobacterium sp. TaxID=417619 RepID=UPI00260E9624